MRPAIVLLLGLMACGGGNKEKPKGVDPIPDGDADTDTDADSDADTDADTDADVDARREAYAFCAAGGSVSGGGISGVTCLSPLDVAGHPATDGNITWTPGPIGRINR